MKKGTKVAWNWGENKAEGKVVQKFNKPISKKIKNIEVKRNASKENPAYLIEQSDGDQVLKLESELKKK